MKTILIILLILIFALFVACNNHNTGGHTHDIVGGHADHGGHGHGHGHDHESGTLSYTMFSSDFELFVEFPALISGQTTTFAAHLTLLSTYKPVLEGALTVSLIRGNKGIRHRVDAPVSPGIFRPSLQPKEAGTYRLLFEMESQTGNVRFEIPDVVVFANAEEAARSQTKESAEDEVVFLKEQAWKSEFSTRKVVLQPFYSVIRTSARVRSQPQSSITVNSQAEGEINLLAVLGQSVKKGDLLAVVTGAGIDNNFNIKLKESKINFEKSKADLIRTKPLAENKVVSQKVFLQIKAQYNQDSLRYTQLANQISKQGLKIISPANGFISNISVSNGQFVNIGSVVFTVKNDSHLLIEAYVNQSDFQKVRGIFDANFSFADGKESVTLKELNGNVKSNNAFLNENITRIPVVFSAMNNGKLMPGMYLEAFLKTGKKENALIVPLTSIIEEQGQYFVFVQTGGETFVKRQVRIANNDGIYTEIASGISVGERIVTKGAFQIKLAAMGGELPLHGHTH